MALEKMPNGRLATPNPVPWDQVRRHHGAVGRQSEPLSEPFPRLPPGRGPSGEEPVQRRLGEQIAQRQPQIIGHSGHIQHGVPDRNAHPAAGGVWMWNWCCSLNARLTFIRAYGPIRVWAGGCAVTRVEARDPGGGAVPLVEAP